MARPKRRGIGNAHYGLVRPRSGKCAVCGRRLTSLAQLNGPGTRWVPTPSSEGNGRCTGVNCAQPRYKPQRRVFRDGMQSDGDPDVPVLVNPAHLTAGITGPSEYAVRGDTPILSALRADFLCRGGRIRLAGEHSDDELRSLAERLGMSLALAHGPVAPARCRMGRDVHGTPVCRAAVTHGRLHCPDHDTHSQ